MSERNPPFREPPTMELLLVFYPDRVVQSQGHTYVVSGIAYDGMIHCQTVGQIYKSNYLVFHPSSLSIQDEGETTWHAPYGMSVP